MSLQLVLCYIECNSELLIHNVNCGSRPAGIVMPFGTKIVWLNLLVQLTPGRVGGDVQTMGKHIYHQVEILAMLSRLPLCQMKGKPNKVNLFLVSIIQVLSEYFLSTCFANQW